MITIKKAQKQDCKLINELASIIFPYTYKDILTKQQIDYMMDWMYSAKSLKDQMDEGHNYFIAYDSYNTPLGYVSVNKEGNDIWHLQKIYVLPEMQGRGIGNILFEKIISYVKEEDELPFKIQLQVNKNNKALGFYLRKGMKKIEEKDFPIGNGYFMNDYILELDVAE